MPRPQSLTARIRDAVTAFYRDSHDFNGMPYDDLVRHHDGPPASLLRAIRALVRRDEISVIFGDIHPNAHIRALPDEPIASQLTKLRIDSNACLYPTPAALAKVVPANLHAERPFTRRLALGEPQLAYAAFDLAVLESYRDDVPTVVEIRSGGSPDRSTLRLERKKENRHEERVSEAVPSTEQECTEGAVAFTGRGGAIDA